MIVGEAQIRISPAFTNFEADLKRELAGAGTRTGKTLNESLAKSTSGKAAGKKLADDVESAGKTAGSRFSSAFGKGLLALGGVAVAKKAFDFLEGSVDRK